MGISQIPEAPSDVGHASSQSVRKAVLDGDYLESVPLAPGKAPFSRYRGQQQSPLNCLQQWGPDTRQRFKTCLS